MVTVALAAAAQSPTSTVTPTPTIAEETLCGQLFQGLGCVLVAVDSPDVFGPSFLLSNYGSFHVGDSVCVTGVENPDCITVCQDGNGCFTVSHIEAAPTSTATPTPTPPPQSCAFLPCSGNCVISPPCTSGTACPNIVELGSCQVVADVCTCVSGSGTPGLTPTFGGCALTSDGRPCVGHCVDGTVAPGLCTELTIDRGCACAPACVTPTPTPAPTGRACMTGLQCASAHCTDGVCCDTDSCPQNQRCDIFGVAGSCSDPLDVDQACGKTTDCLPGLLCLFVPIFGFNACGLLPTPTPTLFPTLTPPPTEIIIVRTRRSCEEHPCAPGLICLFDTDFESKVCDCGGDCNDDFSVTVDELLTMVAVALDETSIGACKLGDVNGDNQFTIDEILTAVNNALEGCSVS